MQPVNYRLEVSGTLVWMAACTVIAMQFTSRPGALAACAGAMLGCVVARLAGRRSARVEDFLTICPFVCALLLLACIALNQSHYAGTLCGQIPVCALAEILLWGGTAFCVSMALDFLKAEFPQATALRGVLAGISFATVFFIPQRPYSVIDFILNAEHTPVDFFMLAGSVITIGAVISCLANPRFTSMVAKCPALLAGLLTLNPEGRLQPSANQFKLPSEVR